MDPNTFTDARDFIRYAVALIVMLAYVGWSYDFTRVMVQHSDDNDK